MESNLHEVDSSVNHPVKTTFRSKNEVDLCALCTRIIPKKYSAHEYTGIISVKIRFQIIQLLLLYTRRNRSKSTLLLIPKRTFPEKGNLHSVEMYRKSGLCKTTVHSQKGLKKRSWFDTIEASLYFHETTSHSL